MLLKISYNFIFSKIYFINIIIKKLIFIYSFAPIYSRRVFNETFHSYEYFEANEMGNIYCTLTLYKKIDRTIAIIISFIQDEIFIKINQNLKIFYEHLSLVTDYRNNIVNNFEILLNINQMFL